MEDITNQLVDLNTIVEILLKFQFQFIDEIELQQGIEQILQTENIEYQREYSLSKKDRVDFLVGKIGIEIKIAGSLSAVTRQVHRYLQHESLEALLLVTTRHVHRKIPEEINGKSLLVLRISSL